MCGIFGYVGRRKALPIILDGLERLEYRGYDSAGVVLLESRGLFVSKCAGKLEALRKKLARRTTDSSVGMGHTRWATHGPPTVANAHPQFSCNREVAIVHNGIIENYRELRDELQFRAHRFTSETDTEVLAHLIEERPDGDPLAAVAAALRRVRGSFAIVAMFRDHPDRIIAARTDSPLVVGLNGGENFVASDIAALLPYTDRFVTVEDGEIVDLRPNRVRSFDLSLTPRRHRSRRMKMTYDEAQKHGFPHYMLKEIVEQPQVIERELQGRDRGFDELKVGATRLRRIRRVILSACGTAAHAALYGKYLLEEITGLPTDVWVSSELRYSPPPMDSGTLLMAISQSGETADTLQAVRLARERGVLTIGMTNTPASTLAREAAGVIYNRAGIEVGVAATKTYLSQLVSLHLFTLRLAVLRGSIGRAFERRRFAELRDLPEHVQSLLAQSPQIRETARRYRRGHDFMYVGRRYNYPTALEGALKMKEISYLHAEGYAAGEMKHGPLALVDPRMVTVAIAPLGSTYDKIVSNIEEIRARNGRIISVVSREDRKIVRLSDAHFVMPATSEALTPIPAVVPLQLLAYHTAAALGRDVDKPRNLAKSVTVE